MSPRIYANIDNPNDGFIRGQIMINCPSPPHKKPTIINTKNQCSPLSRLSMH